LGMQPTLVKRTFLTAKTLGGQPPRARKPLPQSSALRLCRPPLALALRPFHFALLRYKGGETPQLALATPRLRQVAFGIWLKCRRQRPKRGANAVNTNIDHTQELTDKINESITALCAETDAAKQNETYRAWLNTLSRFYSYSFNNWLLIYTQRPDATRVAGFQTWKSLGRFVKKGEHGIRIFAPIIRKIEEEKNGATEQVSRPVGFRSIAVFALEQTDGEPLPEIDSNATEGGEELLPRLEATTASLGIQLVYKAIPGAAEGLSKGGLIEIEETLSTAARCGVIVHELAHELQHKQNRKETTLQQRELEAESVSYAVLAHYGIRTESRFYLASYEVTAEMLTASLQTISQTAKRIISAIDGDETRTECEDGNVAPLP
jgi:antirestriction protein ArdC